MRRDLHSSIDETQVHSLQLGYTHGHHYWLAEGQMCPCRRCSDTSTTCLFLIAARNIIDDNSLNFIITGSAVALHCCKAHSKINRKMGNTTPCKIVTPKNFNLKLCIRDYVGEATHHANFGSNRFSGGYSPYRRNIATLWLFVLTVLSCPVLSCPFFFSGTRPGRTTEPIFTLYGSNDVFSRKEVPFGGQDDVWRHLGEIYSQNPPFRLYGEKPPLNRLEPKFAWWVASPT